MKITFIDSGAGKTVLGTFTTDGSGAVKAKVTIPLDSTVGVQEITAVGTVSRQKANAKFAVT